MTEPLVFVVAEGDAGARLDVLVAREAGVSRASAARLIAAGEVQVDGAAAAKSLRIEAGARIEVARRADAAPIQAEDIDIRILFEDEHLMVVSKPAGLVTHPAPGHAGGTLVNALLAHGAAGGSDPDRPGIVHRLDVGTSGLMIVARAQEPYERLIEAMSARKISRTYLALVEGSPDADSLTIDAPIGRSPKHRKKMAVVATGKPAVTEVRVVERHAETALCEARPITGRTHQIRVHLAAANHPVVGDPAYGRTKHLAVALGLSRPFLHAARLAFAHPITAARVELEDPLPADLVAALERARTR